MRIKLKKLTLKNFKGIKSLEVDFKDITNIAGANRTGKTTIFDALTWLLFGKNKEDKKDFSIKPLDKDNKTTAKLENEVCGVFHVNNEETVSIKRLQREKWVKKRGENEPTFTGNETIFEWNEVPCSLAEYQTKIRSLIDEDFFKLLTNPLYFNSLHWEKRRGMLIGLAPPVPVDYGDLDKFLDRHETFEEAQKRIKSKIKKIKDELKLIPARIDQETIGRPQPLDFKKLAIELEQKNAELSKVLDQIQDKSKVLTEFNEGRMEEQERIAVLKSELSSMESLGLSKFDKGKHDLELRKQNTQNDIEKINIKIKNLDENIEVNIAETKASENKKADLLKDWHITNDTVFEFDEKQGICSTCSQPLPNVDNIETELKENFDRWKMYKLSDTSNDGFKLRDSIEENGKKLKILQSSSEKQEGLKKILDDRLEKINIAFKDSAEFNIDNVKGYPKKKKEYETLSEKFASAWYPEVDVIELEAKKNKIAYRIDAIKAQLQIENQIKECDQRIDALKMHERKLSGGIVELEKTEFAIEGFIKAKMTALEAEVNKKFSFVKFKMFKKQINEGEEPACITLIDGVPFADANSEAKINGGLDIINTFSRHYDIYAPIFIDNREGVTDLIETDTQIINLLVDPIWPELKIDPTPEERAKRELEIFNEKEDLRLKKAAKLLLKKI